MNLQDIKKLRYGDAIMTPHGAALVLGHYQAPDSHVRTLMVIAENKTTQSFMDRNIQLNMRRIRYYDPDDDPCDIIGQIDSDEGDSMFNRYREGGAI